jgi:Acyl-CoA dehydrogenase, C-terminal domain/Acyl-CoA dehydrogenase, middle domain
LAAFTLSEPGAGSNLGAVQTKIVPDGEGAWRIHGTKRWNGSAWTGVITVFGRMVDGDGKARGLSAFVVRQSDPGVKIGPESLTMGVRGIMQNSVEFDGVRVTRERLLGVAGQGMHVANDVLSHGRLATAAVALGAAMRSAQLALRYASRREVETGVLLDNPQAGVHISEMLHRIAIERETLAYCAARLDAGDPIVPEIAMAAKVSATDTGNFCADLLMQLLGGRGYMENNIAPQIFRDTRMLSIGEGANEALISAIGRSLRMADTIGEFLRLYCPAADLVPRLTRLSEGIKNCDGGPYSGSSADVWRDAVRGKLAVAALNLASASAVAAKGGEAETVEWARRRFENLCREAEYGPSSASLALTRDRIRQRVLGLYTLIGDVEPLAPDVDVQLDPLLRRVRPREAPQYAPAKESNLDDALDLKKQRLRELLSNRATTSGGPL